MKNVYWLMIVSLDVNGAPSTMTPTSNDVPPMSQAITFSVAEHLGQERRRR